MTAGIFELAVVMLIAAVLGIVAKFLKQPVILAYLATGAVIGYFEVFKIEDQAALQMFSDLGIMFLLFLIGLEINYTSLRAVGKVSLAVGLGQVVFTSVIGYGIAMLFGFELLPALYIAVALTFSSTIIVVKLLSEKRDVNSLYGKISIGMLLVQDFIAIVILLVLAGIGASEESMWAGIASTMVKGVSLFFFMMWIGRKFLPKLFDRAARYPELLFLISLAWLFLIVAAVEEIGFSIEIAGFLAGLALANLSENFQIAGRIRPLRDFFILLFFVVLGSSFVVGQNLDGLVLPLTAFSLFVLVGNPLIVLAIMGFMGYRKRTAFMAGLTVAQISEFSLVLVALGSKLGHIDAKIVSLVTAVGVTTITLSTYLMLYADSIFRRIGGLLTFFERKVTKENGWRAAEYHKKFILIGAHRTGQSIAMSLPKEDLVIIDFDPEVIAELRRWGFDYVFGDISDPEIMEAIDFDSAHLVISTSPDIEDNLFLISELLSRPRRPKIIMRADDEAQAQLLYRYGADYVLLPNFTAGQYLGKTIALDPELKMLEQLKKRDLVMLRNTRVFAPPSPAPASRGHLHMPQERHRHEERRGPTLPVPRPASVRMGVTAPPPVPHMRSPLERPGARFAVSAPPPPFIPNRVEGPPRSVVRKLPVYYS
jgi:Kef-type K+ transport system membrane component KefB/voltage-gated potassium channel Kch